MIINLMDSVKTMHQVILFVSSESLMILVGLFFAVILLESMKDEKIILKSGFSVYELIRKEDGLSMARRRTSNVWIVATVFETNRQGEWRATRR